MTEDNPNEDVPEAPEGERGDEALSDALSAPEAAISALPRTDEVLRKFAALGAQRAFQIDPDVLAQFKVPELDTSGLQEAQRIAAERLFPPELLESLKIPSSALANIRLPDSFWQSINVTARLLRESVSVDALYSKSQLALAASSGRSLEPRPSRTPEAFFGEHAVEIDSVSALLRALSAVQSKHYQHRPVWRGQQDVSFEVHSSLYRKLEPTEADVENRLSSAEVQTLAAAKKWGLRARRPLEFLAKLQHNGAPTRLLDATVDPEIATWFAVESHPKHDLVDGLVLGWGREPRTKPMVAHEREYVPESTDVPFWHAWTTNEERHRVDWGTGTKTWTWFPPALTDRMRAQRAGFLIEAGPILTEAVVAVFTDALSQDWRASEIAKATSIVGLPSRHDVQTKPNAANLVPVFAFRILASAKREIRTYLEGKGLTSATIYPDLGGLVQHLRGPFGLS